jgi:SagB-type dehydrogenase family enzyme
MFKHDDSISLPLLYHVNSEPWLNFGAYSDPAAEVQFKQITEPGKSLALPRPEQKTSLAELLTKRRSCRRFVSQEMALDQLAALLLDAYGGLEVIASPNGLPNLARPVPSAGGLYSLELYLVLDNIADISDGLYHYNVLHHRLEPMMPKEHSSEFHDCLLAPNFLEHANVALIITSVFDRCLRKYGPRGYRYVLLEAGHVAQNLCLSAAQQGLGSLCVGGFRDATLNRFLGLDETQEGVLYAVGIGCKEAE